MSLTNFGKCPLFEDKMVSIKEIERTPASKSLRAPFKYDKLYQKNDVQMVKHILGQPVILVFAAREDESIGKWVK